MNAEERNEIKRLIGVLQESGYDNSADALKDYLDADKAHAAQADELAATKDALRCEESLNAGALKIAGCQRCAEYQRRIEAVRGIVDDELTCFCDKSGRCERCQILAILDAPPEPVRAKSAQAEVSDDNAQMFEGRVMFPEKNYRRAQTRIFDLHVQREHLRGYVKKLAEGHPDRILAADAEGYLHGTEEPERPDLMTFCESCGASIDPERGCSACRQRCGQCDKYGWPYPDQGGEE